MEHDLNTDVAINLSKSQRPSASTTPIITTINHHQDNTTTTTTAITPTNDDDCDDVNVNVREGDCIRIGSAGIVGAGHNIDEVSLLFVNTRELHEQLSLL